MKPKLDEILNKERIKILEDVIPFLESILNASAEEKWYKQGMRHRLFEYRLEYRERTGKEYNQKV